MNPCLCVCLHIHINIHTSIYLFISIYAFICVYPASVCHIVHWIPHPPGRSISLSHDIPHLDKLSCLLLAFPPLSHILFLFQFQPCSDSCSSYPDSIRPTGSLVISDETGAVDVDVEWLSWSLFKHPCVYVCVSVCMGLSMHVCGCPWCMRVRVRAYVRLCMCVYVYVYVNASVVCMCMSNIPIHINIDPHAHVHASAHSVLIPYRGWIPNPPVNWSIHPSGLALPKYLPPG